MNRTSRPPLALDKKEPGRREGFDQTKPSPQGQMIRTKEFGLQEKGDIAAAIQDAAVVYKGYYGIETISHMCLEPHGSHCEWNGTDKLDVHLSTQNVSGTAGQFAGRLGDRRGEGDDHLQLHRRRIRLEVRRG